MYPVNKDCSAEGASKFQRTYILHREFERKVRFQGFQWGKQKSVWHSAALYVQSSTHGSVVLKRTVLKERLCFKIAWLSAKYSVSPLSVGIHFNTPVDA